MFRDVEMNHPPAMMNQDHQDEQNPKCRGRDGEEIYRDQFCEMVVQKSPPGLGRGLQCEQAASQYAKQYEGSHSSIPALELLTLFRF
jgi:hypothetical protein